MAKQPRSLGGKVAVITGGGRGIGKALGQALAREGARVAIGDLDTAAAEGAAAVLRGALARIAADGMEAYVEWITARQAWAVPVCLEAGLRFSTNAGPVFTGGDVGPFRPYLPSGAYL